ncbi:hypothetical protein ACWKW4_20915 [Hydrogenophaga borbori]
MEEQDWFRCKNWNANVEELFFSKLQRARTQRDQYLAIQALTLSQGHPDVALRLVEHYFSTKKSDFEDLRALLAKANALISKDLIAEAIETYKAILSLEKEKPNQRSRAFVDLPYLVATRQVVDEYPFALSVLEERSKDVVFPVDLFIWHASLSLILEATGERQAAATHAGKALDAAQVKKSGFRFHSKVGLVGVQYAQGVEEMRRIYKAAEREKGPRQRSTK